MTISETAAACATTTPTSLDAHVAIDPAILYFGTPVAIISSLNADGSTNLAPMSSVFWLDDRAVLGLARNAQTSENLEERSELVINLPEARQVAAVDRLALTTGRPEVPESKSARGYRHVPDKFDVSGLRGVPSETVAPKRLADCPVNLEARIIARHPLAAEDPRRLSTLTAYEAVVTKVWVHRRIRLSAYENRIDPDRWRPLIMSFQRFYGLGEELHPSRLATIDEDLYR